uniref:Uncharacterized protein n=1 Tax=Caudovirales sp. ctCVG11 TaxID=2825759 RepID=A0A8S5UAK7_9CAUD|nr:MAG TPA: hypothetical protein [Caudovirales sp. ctCVG11]
MKAAFSSFLSTNSNKEFLLCVAIPAQKEHAVKLKMVLTSRVPRLSTQYVGSIQPSGC